MNRFRFKKLSFSDLEFFKNISTVASGNLISQILPFIFAPIITRLYDPSDFGALALFVSTAAFFQSFATLKFETAIQIPKNDDDAVALMSMSFYFIVITSLLALLLLIFFEENFLIMFDNANLGNWIYFIPIMILITTPNLIFNIWTSRKKKFNRIAKYNIFQTSVTPISKILISLFLKINGGLILGTLIGNFFSRMAYMLEIIIYDKINFFVISFKKFREIAYRYKNFSIYLTGQQITGRFKETGIIYVITYFFGSYILGLYSLAHSMMYKPVIIIGQAVSNVYYQKSAELLNERKQIWPFTKRLIIRLTISALIIFTPFIIFGPEIFGLIFGEKWFVAGTYAQILCPWLIIVFVEQGFSKLYLVFEKQRPIFLINLFFHPLIFLTIFCLSSLFDLDFIIILISLVFIQIIPLIYKFLLCRKWAIEYDSKLLR